MLIDSHHHLWTYDADQYPWIDDSMLVLQNDFGLSQLQAVAMAAGVDGFVTVQARQCLAETAALLQLAEQSELILGVVGWLPLAGDDLAESLERFGQSPWLKGVRHVVQDEPDPEFLLGADFNRGVSRLSEFGWVYDLLIRSHQLPAAIEFVDRHPDLPIVVDHIAKPTIRPGQWDQQWQHGIRELARRDHVLCKFSGVVTEIHGSDPSDDHGWNIDDIQPYWETTLEAFSPTRLMFGSDWPVCLLRTSYADWLQTVRRLASELSPLEQRLLFAENAIKTYRLTQASRIL